MSQHSTALSREEVRAGARLSHGTARGPPPPDPNNRRLLSFRDLKLIKGIKFSRQWINTLIAGGKFPRPVQPGGGMHKAWFEHEIDQYLDDLASARDGNAAA
jgi:predicted DNA-binding transcriptional regulator AlpA